MKRGIFITFEGPDGSGKSTQIKYLQKHFDELGMETVFTREPGGTSIGEKLRRIILDKNNSEMSDMTEALLYAASRAQHVHELIKPALESNKVVVCDRFIDSSIAYQGYGRNLGDCVRTINELAIEGCMPDITFLMDLPPEIGKSRLREGHEDRLELEQLEFHNKVFEGYKEIAKIYPKRFVLIDACRNKGEIKADILRHVDELLQNRG